MSLSVFELRGDAEHFPVLGIKAGPLQPISRVMAGAAIGSIWVLPIIEKIVDDGEDVFTPLGDFASLEGTPAFSKRAVDCLHEMLVANGELLSVISDVGEFYAYNVTRVVDALDEEQSVITRFQSSGRVMEINKYAFHTDRVEGLTVFKIPQHIRLPVLVTTAFVDEVARHKLTGFRFGLVWLESGP